MVWHALYSVSQKSSPPPKTQFCQYVASLYLHIFTNFCWFVLIFNKTALIFPGVPIVLTFPVSSFTKSYRNDFIANNEWSPNSSDLNPLDYKAWGKWESYLQTATEAKNSSQVYRCTLADLVCLAAESHWHAVKDNCNWLRACVSANGENFEHVMWQFV